MRKEVEVENSNKITLVKITLPTNSQDTSPATLKTLGQKGMTIKPVSPQVQKHNRVDKRKETKRKYRKFKRSKDRCRKKKKNSCVNRVQNKSHRRLCQTKQDGKTPRSATDWINRTVLGRGRPPEKTSSEDQAQPRESEECF
jgi:hypothetical protein